MKTTTSRTDLVKKMRDIRDKFSLEIMDMSFEQEREYVKTQLAELKLKKHGRQYVILPKRV
jgi:hypothetical protein